jgi:hypothetical protein
MPENRITLPKDTEVAKTFIAAQMKEKGWIGAMIGSKDHAPYSLTFIALLIVGVLLISAFFAPMQGIDKGTVIPVLLSTLTGIIGFVFGSRAKSD